MIDLNIGQIAAFVTAICWTITPIAFEAAGKRVGSLSVNFIRLILAFFLIGIFTFTTRGMFLPLDASINTWLWLSVSGVIGFVLGDLFLFEAFVLIGSRISLLIMAVVPPITALIGFFILGERLTVLDLLGMFITMGGIFLVILVKGSNEKKVKLSHPIKGISYAFIGAIGQAVGMVFSKLGMGNYNAFAATQIRIIAATVAFAIIITLRKNWSNLALALKDFKAVKYISIGSFFGPFIGVSLSLLAVQYISTGVASTISSVSRILIIPISIIVFKEKVSAKEVLGAAITIGGVALLFI
ncbi:DMT family transporter [Clostridium tagluense]|uniref:DMT family transporter n=1 Tax=Clostridium tagluense TaxID=360422 RepID=UPI001C6DD7D5|nr:DMT family transporter [Clostridium tagluense]MBW9159750.1 DMT family transporter [Clostridium tagluense]WLC66648.1 DMT family transporter [Clostridium tagluense]